MTDRSYHAPEGGLPPQTRLMTGRAVFTEAYAVIPGGCMSDIVASLLPFWEGARFWVLARPMSGFAETFAQYAVELAPGGGSNDPEPDHDAQAVLFVAHGTARLTLGRDSYELRPGSYAYIPPGNHALSEAARRARIDEIFTPFQEAVARQLARSGLRATFSIHSYTPRMRDGQPRAWDAGFLFREDRATSERLARALQALSGDLTIGLNQPYDVDAASDWFVPRHAEPSGLPHSLVEIRNDHIREASGQALWTTRLAHIFRPFLMETSA